jgi:hypothetical protein
MRESSLPGLRREIFALIIFSLRFMVRLLPRWLGFSGESEEC